MLFHRNRTLWEANRALESPLSWGRSIRRTRTLFPKLKWTRRESNPRPRQHLRDFIRPYSLPSDFLSRPELEATTKRVRCLHHPALWRHHREPLALVRRVPRYPGAGRLRDGGDGAHEAHAAQLCENGFILGTFGFEPVLGGLLIHRSSVSRPLPCRNQVGPVLFSKNLRLPYSRTLPWPSSFVHPSLYPSTRRVAVLAPAAPAAYALPAAPPANLSGFDTGTSPQRKPFESS